MKVFKQWVFESIKKDVFITTPESPYYTSGTRSRQGESIKYLQIVFPLHVESKSTIDLSIKAIKCVFTYNGLVMQSLDWEHGDKYADNGTEIVTADIIPKGNCDVMCRFNPFPYMPLLPESNERWGVEGAIEFQCFYGTLKKEFACDGLSIGSTSDWTEIRSVYKRLYLSIFGEGEYVVIS